MRWELDSDVCVCTSPIYCLQLVPPACELSLELSKCNLDEGGVGDFFIIFFVIIIIINFEEVKKKKKC